MRIALIADVHGNREAFDAVLEAAAREEAGRIVLLGDLVGYGADPAYVVERARELAARGAVVVKGDHDAAAAGVGAPLDESRRAALEWTRAALDDGQRAFLAGLPMTVEDGDRLYVHASAARLSAWPYITDVAGAEESLAATRKRVTLCGHAHRPAIFSQPADQTTLAFVPATDAPIPLLGIRRWLAVLGSCGQPRDGAGAAYAILDEATRSLCFRRVAFDAAATARKILAAGLPQTPAARLHAGG
jgi:predicted phosphodiesterase